MVEEREREEGAMEGREESGREGKEEGKRWEERRLKMGRGKWKGVEDRRKDGEVKGRDGDEDEWEGVEGEK